MNNTEIEQIIASNGLKKTVIPITSQINLNIYPSFGSYSFELEDVSLPFSVDRFSHSSKSFPLDQVIATVKEMQSQNPQDGKSIAKKFSLLPGPDMFNSEYLEITTTRVDRFEVTPEMQKRLTIRSRFTQGTDLNNIDKYKSSVDFSNAIIRTDYGEFQSYEELADVAYFSIECDEENISTKSGAISNAIIGGIIAGGVGAIIGGASADTIHKKNIKKVSVKISFSDSASTTITINLYSREKWSQHHSAHSALEMANRLKTLIDSAKSTKATSKSIPPPPSTNPNDIVEKLTKITDLYQSGLLSAEEFSFAKKRLLDN